MIFIIIMIKIMINKIFKAKAVVQSLRFITNNRLTLSASLINFNCNQRKLHSGNYFMFSSEKKPSFDNLKPQSQNKGQTNNQPSQDAEMDAKDPNDPLKKLDPDGLKSAGGIQQTQFGNYMIMLSIGALLLAYAYMEIQSMRAETRKKKSTVTSKVSQVGKVKIGGEWQLTDTDGHKFGSKDLAGSYYLIYFGFTNCPDICPNSLRKISKAVQNVKKRKQSAYFKLKTIFVSVDPDRDTPEKIKKFMHHFDPEMIGVTGSSNMDPALRNCMKSFKIYSSKIQFEDAETTVKGRKSYTIDHTILTYLISDTNQYIAHLGANMGEYDLTNQIIDKILEDQKSKMHKLKAI